MKHFHSTRIVILSLVLVVSVGCSNKSRKPPEPEITFSPFIEKDGSKLFQLVMELPEGDNKRAGHKGGGRGKPPGGGGSRDGGDAGQAGARQHEGGVREQQEFKGRQSMLERALRVKLAETGYCREGHVVIDSYAYRGVLRGQCVEFASDEDLKRFPKASARPVKVIYESLDKA